ncbi:hypothetical protein HMPREF1390_07076 [Staphylococcus epidermidis NIH08001]|nr:hypothetical protein HMPREF1390_07076 [Staphylococcus epidermidis NIH08001]
MPEMSKGSSPTDDGGLIFSEYEYQNTVEMYPELKKILKKYRGSKEYIEDINRYVLWMSNNEVKLFEKNPVIKKRLEHVRLFRLGKKIIL